VTHATNFFSIEGTWHTHNLSELLVTGVHLQEPFTDIFKGFLCIYAYAAVENLPTENVVSTVQSIISATRFLKLLTRMPTLLYSYTFLCVFSYLISCFYTHVSLLCLSHFYTASSCVTKYLIMFLVLIVIGVLHAFLVIGLLYVFDDLMMVVWTTETGNYFNNIVVWDWKLCFLYSNKTNIILLTFLI
jgi:hypothetical protein